MLCSSSFSKLFLFLIPKYTSDLSPFITPTFTLRKAHCGKWTNAIHLPPNSFAAPACSLHGALTWHLCKMQIGLMPLPSLKPFKGSASIRRTFNEWKSFQWVSIPEPHLLLHSLLQLACSLPLFSTTLTFEYFLIIPNSFSLQELFIYCSQYLEYSHPCFLTGWFLIIPQNLH